MPSVEAAHSLIRKATRVPTRVAIKLGGSNSTTTAVVTDLSVRGMFVEMEDPPMPGTAITFEVVLDDKEVRGMGKVVWVRTKDQETAELPSGAGIQFVAVRDKTRVLDQVRDKVNIANGERASLRRTVGRVIRRIPLELNRMLQRKARR